MKMKDAVVLITGASSGIGAATAKAASRGSAACLSWAAGLNFSAMLSLHCKANALAFLAFPD